MRENQRREEICDRGEETNFPKKLIRVRKKLTKNKTLEFKIITVVPSKTSVYCLKCEPSMFQKVLLKQQFFSNYFQTALFQTLPPNMFFQILNTSVQCLNTEH